MEVLQLLSKDDMVALQRRFAAGANGEGLSQPEFIAVFTEVIQCKARGDPYVFEPDPADATGDDQQAGVINAPTKPELDVFGEPKVFAQRRDTRVAAGDIAAVKANVERLHSITSENSSAPVHVLAERADLLLRWTAAELATLFLEVDFNGDRTVSFEEFTSFAIASAVHQNQTSSQERAFKDYLQMQDLPFLNQSKYLRNVIYLTPGDRVISSGFTRTLAHDSKTGRQLHVVPKSGQYLDAAFVPSQGMYAFSNDQNQLLFLEDAPAGSPSHTELIFKHIVQCDRAVTHVKYVPFRCRLVLGDRDGVVRTVSFDKLRVAAIRNNVTLTTITHCRCKIFDDGIGCLVALPTGTPVATQSESTAGLKAEPMNSVLMVTAASGTEVVLFDCEIGSKLRSIGSGLTTPIRDVSYSANHHLVLCCSNDDYFTATAVDQPQQYPYEVRDVTSPHLHPLLHVHSIPNSHRVLTMDHSGVIKLWDLRQMTCSITFALPRTAKNEVNSVMGYRFDDLNDRFIALGRETMAFEYDSRITAMFAHDDPLVALLYSRHFNAVLSITGTQFRHWSLSSGTAIATRKDLNISTSDASAAAASAGPTGASGPTSTTVEVTCASIDDINGRQIFLGFSDGSIAGVLVTTGRELWRRQVSSSKSRIVFVNFICRGTYLVGTFNGFVFIVTEAEGGGIEVAQVNSVPKRHGFSISCFAPGAGIAAVASSTHRRTVYLFDGQHRNSALLFDNADQPRIPEVSSLAFVVDGGATTYGTARPMTPLIANVRGTNELSVIAVADTGGHVTLWSVGRNVNVSALRQFLVTVRSPRKAVVTSITCVGGRYMVCGTESGSVVMWDLASLLLHVCAQWTPSWTAENVASAARNVPKLPRFVFNAVGQDHISSIVSIPYAQCVVVGTADDDPLLFIWNLRGERLGALCRGRGTAAADELGSIALYDFDSSGFSPPIPGTVVHPDVTTSGSDFGSQSVLAPTALADFLFGAPAFASPADQPESCVTSRIGAATISPTTDTARQGSGFLSSPPPQDDVERRRRKRQRHQRKHWHDLDMVRVETLEQQTPGFLQDLIFSDPLVARHQGAVSPVRRERDDAESRVATNAAITLTTKANTAREATTASPAAGPRGILKSEVDRVPSAMLALIREQAEKPIVGRGGQFGTMRLRASQAGENASSPLGSIGRRERSASVAFVHSQDSCIADFGIVAEASTTGPASPPLLPEATAGSRRASFLALDGDGKLSRRGSTDSMLHDHALDHRRAFQRLDGATPTQDLDDAKAKSTAYRLGQSSRVSSNTVGPASPPGSPTRPHFHGARLRKFKEAVVPASVTLPKIPLITSVERGWQQVVRGAEDVAHAPQEVSSRTAERILLMQYEAEVAKAKQDRADFLKAHLGPVSHTKPNAVAAVLRGSGDEAAKAAKRIANLRLDRVVEERRFELGTSTVSFTARAWKQRSVASNTARRGVALPGVL